MRAVIRGAVLGNTTPLDDKLLSVRAAIRERGNMRSKTIFRPIGFAILGEGNHMTRETGFWIYKRAENSHGIVC